MQQRQAMKLVD